MKGEEGCACRMDPMLRAMEQLWYSSGKQDKLCQKGRKGRRAKEGGRFRTESDCGR